MFVTCSSSLLELCSESSFNVAFIVFFFNDNSSFCFEKNEQSTLTFPLLLDSKHLGTSLLESSIFLFFLKFKNLLSLCFFLKKF